MVVGYKRHLRRFSDRESGTGCCFYHCCQQGQSSGLAAMMRPYRGVAAILDMGNHCSTVSASWELMGSGTGRRSRFLHRQSRSRGGVRGLPHKPSREPFTTSPRVWDAGRQPTGGSCGGKKTGIIDPEQFYMQKHEGSPYHPAVLGAPLMKGCISQMYPFGNSRWATSNSKSDTACRPLLEM